MFSDRDEFWMQHALSLAKQAAKLGEVPVGAVIIRQDELISEAYNSPIATSDPTAHAEILALRKAASEIGNYRLIDCVLYTTLEPCIMCAGAIVHARIKRLVHGTYDAKAGAVSSCTSLLDSSFINHKVMHQGGLLAEECSQLLSSFFAERRK